MPAGKCVEVASTDTHPRNPHQGLTWGGDGQGDLAVDKLSGHLELDLSHQGGPVKRAAASNNLQLVQPYIRSRIIGVWAAPSQAITNGWRRPVVRAMSNGAWRCGGWLTWGSGRPGVQAGPNGWRSLCLPYFLLADRIG